MQAPRMPMPPFTNNNLGTVVDSSTLRSKYPICTKAILALEQQYRMLLRLLSNIHFFEQLGNGYSQKITADCVKPMRKAICLLTPYIRFVKSVTDISVIVYYCRIIYLLRNTSYDRLVVNRHGLCQGINVFFVFIWKGMTCFFKF